MSLSRPPRVVREIIAHGKLIRSVQRGRTPDPIHEEFADKALGENRETLMAA